MTYQHNQLTLSREKTMANRKETYGNYMSRNSQNTKTLGSAIRNIDTFRGCPHACESCYAKKNSAKTIEKFEIPVKVEKFTGKRQDDDWYRIGNSGDPASGWAYSEQLVKEQGFKKFFCVTKLQNLRGFTGYFDKLQVSVDTINEKHFERTLKNVETILKEFPRVKIMLRIRSISTTNLILMMRQNEAVAFANAHDLPVLETRVRFNKKSSREKYDLSPEDYEMRQDKITRPVHGKKFVVGANRFYDCDMNGAKCESCSNCTLPWSDKQYEKKGDFIAPHKELTMPLKKAA